jgi:hypothetical protein
MPYWNSLSSSDIATTYSPVFSSSGGTSQISYTGTPATGSYIRRGNLVTFRIRVDYTTLTSFGGGAGNQYFVTLPFVPAALYSFNDGLYQKGSNSNRYEILGTTNGTTTMSMWHSAGSGNAPAMSHSTPVSAQTADYFYISGTYEVA